MDSTEVCTDYLETWLVNDSEEVLAEAQRRAQLGTDELAGYVRGVLDNAQPGTGAWHTRRELSDDELDQRIDWADVAAVILDQ